MRTILLYSPGNYTQCLAITYLGKESEKDKIYYIYTYVYTFSFPFFPSNFSPFRKTGKRDEVEKFCLRLLSKNRPDQTRF